MDWKGDILAQLERRDAVQYLAFNELITSVTTSTRNWKKCEERLQLLEAENTQLKAQNADFQRSLSQLGAGKVPMVNQKEVDELKNKLNDTNERMLELLSKQNSVNQKLVDMNEQLRTKEDEVKRSKESEIKLHERIAVLEKQSREQAELLSHKEITSQVLHDELQALQLELLAREDRVKDLEKENKALLERWLHKMNEEAAKMNQENEQFESNQRSSLVTEAMKMKIDNSEPDNLLEQLNGVQALLPNRTRKKIVAHESEINCIATSHNGKFFATGSADRKIKIFEGNTGNIRHTIRGCQQGVMSVQFSTNDDLILGASNDNTTKIWSIETGRARHTLTGHIHKVYTAKFSFDTSKVISGSYDRTIKIWDLVRGFCMRTIFSYSSVNDLCLTDETGNHVISGHLDNHIRFWDTKNGELVNEITEIHSGQVTSVTLSPDGTKILTNSRDNTLKLIDLKMFQVINTYSAENFRTGTNWSKACFSPDGVYVAAGSSDGSLYIWDTLTTKVEKVLKDHNGSVNAVAWSPLGEFLYSADKDKNVVIWEP